MILLRWIIAIKNEYIKIYVFNLWRNHCIWVNVCFVYLLQRGVRDTVAGQAKVNHSQVELLEERSKRSVSGSAIRQYESDFLTDALQKDSLRDMAPQELSHSCQICFTESQKINQNTDLAGQKVFISPKGLINLTYHLFQSYKRALYPLKKK